MTPSLVYSILHGAWHVLRDSLRMVSITYVVVLTLNTLQIALTGIWPLMGRPQGSTIVTVYGQGFQNGWILNASLGLNVEACTMQTIC